MASKNEMPIDPTPGQDAVELLTADHKRVARLFAEFDALKEEGSDEEKSGIVARICQELTVHTALEEEIFYPAVRKAIGDDDLMDEALVEHAGAKDLIAQLQAADPDDELYDAKVTVLGEQIDHHVMEEEGSMFPQARGSGVDTASLGSEMLVRKAALLGDSAAPSSKEKNDVEYDDKDDGDEEEDAVVKPKRPASPPKSTARSAVKKKASKKKH